MIAPVWRSFHENVCTAICIARDEIGGGTIKCHIASVSRNRGSPAGAITLHAGRIGRNAWMAPVCRSFTKILAEIRIARDQIGGEARERHIAPVGRNRRCKAVIVALYAARILETRVTAPVCRSFTKISYVSDRIARDQIGGEAHERHIAPVGRDRRFIARTVRLRAGSIGRDADDGPSLQILHEKCRKRNSNRRRPD